MKGNNGVWARASVAGAPFTAGKPGSTDKQRAHKTGTTLESMVRLIWSSTESECHL